MIPEHQKYICRLVKSNQIRRFGAYAETDSLSNPKRYDTLRSDRWFRSYRLNLLKCLKIGLKTLKIFLVFFSCAIILNMMQHFCCVCSSLAVPAAYFHKIKSTNFTFLGIFIFCVVGWKDLEHNMYQWHTHIHVKIFSFHFLEIECLKLCDQNRWAFYTRCVVLFFAVPTWIHLDI